MSDTTRPTPPPPSPSESDAGRSAVPVSLVLLFFLLLYWGFVYFDHRSGWFSPLVYAPYHSLTEVQLYQPPTEGPNLAHGQEVFGRTCGLCHGIDGNGTAQAPPFAGSEWVNAKGVNRLIHIPVLGLTGPIEVNGKQYSFPNGMTPIAANRQMMSDEDLADVLTYIRQSFGNKAPAVTPQEVKVVRDAIGNRTAQLTVDEMKSLPEAIKK